MNTSVPVRILVVDDDPALRDLLRDYLTANGFVVDAVNDGVEMLARLAQAMPDAIVLDLMLPGEDGLSLARGLRKTSDVPILMLSARGEEIDRVAQALKFAARRFKRAHDAVDLGVPGVCHEHDPHQDSIIAAWLNTSLRA